MKFNWIILCYFAYENSLESHLYILFAVCDCIYIYLYIYDFEKKKKRFVRTYKTERKKNNEKEWKATWSQNKYVWKKENTLWKINPTFGLRKLDFVIYIVFFSHSFLLFFSLSLSIDSCWDGWLFLLLLFLMLMVAFLYYDYLTDIFLCSFVKIPELIFAAFIAYT